MNTYVIFRRSAWASPQLLERAASRSRRVGEEMQDRIRWIRSYVLRDANGTLGTVCVYQATDEETIREHARRADLPADEILPVGDTVIVRPDPAGDQVVS